MLKHESRDKLNLSARVNVAYAADRLTEKRIQRRAVVRVVIIDKAVKIRIVENIENIGAQFETRVFRNAETSRQRSVETLLRRADERVARETERSVNRSPVAVVVNAGNRIDSQTGSDAGDAGELEIVWQINSAVSDKTMSLIEIRRRAFGADDIAEIVRIRAVMVVCYAVGRFGENVIRRESIATSETLVHAD